MTTPTPDPLADLPGLLAQAGRQLAVPGLLAAATAGDAIVAEAAHGWAEQDRRPAHTGLVSRWYSISKAVTALVFAQCAAAGRIDLDAPVTGLVPGLGFDDPEAQRQASLRDCLLHRTGLAAGDWTWDGAATTDLIGRIRHLPCSVGFRRGFAYQNLHFAIAEAALARAGIPWDRAVADLLAPLGIRPRTSLASLVASGRLLPHGPNGLGPAAPIADVDSSAIASASLLSGTVAELAAVGGMMAGNGTWRGATVLPRDRWDATVAPVVDLGQGSRPEITSCWAALAGRWWTYRGHRLLWWSGGYRGYTAWVAAIPQLGISACALCNRSASPVVEAVVLTLLDRLAGLSHLPWIDRYADSKRRMRAAGAEKLAHRLARARSRRPPPRSGCFHHPAYGDLRIEAGTDGARLCWRGLLDLPLVPRDDGTWSADGLLDGSEITWDLVWDGEAWRFNPDDPHHPLPFVPAGR